MTPRQRAELALAELDELIPDLPNLRTEIERFKKRIRETLSSKPEPAVLRAVRRGRSSRREIIQAVRHFPSADVRDALDRLVLSGQLMARSRGRSTLYFEPDHAKSTRHP